MKCAKIAGQVTSVNYSVNKNKVTNTKNAHLKTVKLRNDVSRRHKKTEYIPLAKIVLVEEIQYDQYVSL
jgi:hypothetical protein